jgi:hypothetical protein
MKHLPDGLIISRPHNNQYNEEVDIRFQNNEINQLLGLIGKKIDKV